MKRTIYTSVVLLLLIIIYVVGNFLLLDKWNLYQSERQLNNYIENHNNDDLKQISKDDKTYKFLKEKNQISIIGKSDNQGSGSLYYYRAKINNKPTELYIKCHHAFIPEKPTVQSVKLL
ncbi:hypothetical protein [Staphylococcus succinus]|uniref:hypothetical protein n=1 Tax=Staphylococcus succinus TaxID=61015 RepID=UPI000E67E9D0|nr:hypothetical protein [Staphylococcus succinus]RIN27685.1 hypothetical protein BU067_01380 [Staphylococcus succinus]